MYSRIIKSILQKNPNNYEDFYKILLRQKQIILMKDNIKLRKFRKENYIIRKNSI